MIRQLRRLRTILFGEPRPKYQPTHSMRFTPQAMEEPRRYTHGPGDITLPRHNTITVPAAVYADVCDTRNLPAAPPAPPLTPGRDLLTGEPRMFGLSFLTALDNISAALSVRSVAYFGA